MPMSVPSQPKMSAENGPGGSKGARAMRASRHDRRGRTAPSPDSFARSKGRCRASPPTPIAAMQSANAGDQNAFAQWLTRTDLRSPAFQKGSSS